MSEIELRPPLPAHLANDGVPFVSGISAKVRGEVLAAIGAALNALLPKGDLTVLPDGQIRLASSETERGSQSLWRHAGRLESIERSRI
jgi:hypothetical protein